MNKCDPRESLAFSKLYYACVVDDSGTREKPDSGHGRCFGTIAKRYATCPRNVDIELRSHVHESFDR